MGISCTLTDVIATTVGIAVSATSATEPVCDTAAAVSEATVSFEAAPSLSFESLLSAEESPASCAI